MRRVGAIVAFGAMLAILAPPLQAQSKPFKQSDGERQVCKEKAKTGTRFRTRTCKSAAEWDRIAEEHRRSAAEMINRPVIDTQRGN